ncbi:hypothetical protein [Nannocystis sp.]|uniref:hypothetical protein n=1 Tax=Nannocystis sp. TaxID=1962667 RepID=UPI0026010735|nr:hypothetical protein [Nannocystis sp.]MBK7825037.1 hypothetical protein [Nannocystis sp.]
MASLEIEARFVLVLADHLTDVIHDEVILAAVALDSEPVTYLDLAEFFPRAPGRVVIEVGVVVVLPEVASDELVLLSDLAPLVATCPKPSALAAVDWAH